MQRWGLCAPARMHIHAHSARAWSAYTGTKLPPPHCRWNKHGTCALSSLPDEHTYFKAILDLNAKYDLEVGAHWRRVH